MGLLKLNERQVFEDFFDTLTENSFYPKITLPTRFSNKHGMLIDNLFRKLTDSTINTSSSILIKMFSDHQPYFTFLNDILHKDCLPKFIKVNAHSQESIKTFQDELINLDIISKIDKSPTVNPNVNYNKVHDLIDNAKNKHLPFKMVTFNKYKHKKSKWITGGLITSIKYRDNLYKKLKLNELTGTCFK